MSRPSQILLIMMVAGGLLLFVQPQDGGGDDGPGPKPEVVVVDAFDRMHEAMRKEYATNLRTVADQNLDDAEATTAFNALHKASKAATGDEWRTVLAQAIDGGPNAMRALADALEGAR